MTKRPNFSKYYNVKCYWQYSGSRVVERTVPKIKGSNLGDTTLSIMTFRITTLKIMTFRITTLRIMTLNITTNEW